MRPAGEGQAVRRGRFPGRGSAAAAATAVLALLTWQGAGEHGWLSALGEVLAMLAPWIVVVVGAAEAAGRLMGSRLRGGAHLAWDGAAGLAGLMAVAVALAWLPGGFSQVIAWLTVVALAPWAVGSRLWRPGPPAAAGGRPGMPGLVSAVAWGVTALGLLWARVPPVFFDTLSYHFAQPSLWLVEGRIAPVEWSLMSWFPPGVSVLYGLGLAWGGEGSAAMANVALALMALLMAADLAGRLGGAGAARAAALLVPALPIFIYGLAIPAADLGHGLFAFGALAAWVASRRGPGGPWLQRSALLAGGALLTKYLGVIVPLVPVALLWALAPPESRLRRPGRVPGLPMAARLVTLALAMLAPWLVANAVVTGNPVAPMLDGLLPVPSLADGAVASFHGDARAGLPTAADLARLPAGLVTGDPETRVYPSPAWGWLPLLLVAAWAAWRPRVDGMFLLAGLALMQVAAWLATSRWERFLVAASLTMAVALALGASALWRRGRGPRLLLAALALGVGLPGAVQAAVSVQRFTGGLPVALGLETPESFRRRSLPLAALHGHANQTLDPARHRLLLLGESRHHGLTVPRAAPTPFNRHPVVELLRKSADPEAVRRGLRRAGYTHLAVDAAQVARSAGRYPSLRLLAERRELLPALLEHLGPPVWRRQGAGLWDLRREPGSLTPPGDPDR